MEVQLQEFNKAEKKVAFEDVPINSEKKDFINDEENIKLQEEKISVPNTEENKDKQHIKEENNAPIVKQNASNNKNSYILTFFMWTVLLLLYTIMIYVIKPITLILEIIFLTSIVNVRDFENNENYNPNLSNWVLVIGWLIIIFLPFFNLFKSGWKIILLQDSFLKKVWVTTLLIIEVITNIPMTFCYEHNLYSIFLFEETGITQLLNTWVIFFPTEYILSPVELIRNFIESGFFIGISFIKYFEIQKNYYQVYKCLLLQVLIAFCIMKIIYNTANLVIKIKRNCSSKETENYAKMTIQTNLKDSNNEKTADKKNS